MNYKWKCVLTCLVSYYWYREQEQKREGKEGGEGEGGIEIEWVCIELGKDELKDVERKELEY